MADLLTHVLVPFIILTVLRWRFDSIKNRWVPVAMGGAVIPDLGKIEMLVADTTVEAILGVPFSWSPVGSLLGVIVLAMALAVWFGPQWRQAYGWLVFGGLTALVLDGMRVFADGSAGFYLYPLWWRPPTPNIYVSADYRVTLLVVIVAIVVYQYDQRIAGRDES